MHLASDRNFSWGLSSEFMAFCFLCCILSQTCKAKKEMLKNLVQLATTCTVLLILSVCESLDYSWRKQFITCKTFRIKMLNLQIQALTSSENEKNNAIKAISHQLFYMYHGWWQFKLQNHGLLLHQKKMTENNWAYDLRHSYSNLPAFILSCFLGKKVTIQAAKQQKIECAQSLRRINF